jgi:predicted adenylyl cyclase CyaB
VPRGRLKLREGNIEHALIYYERPDTTGAKRSDVLLYQHQPDGALKDILVKLHGIKVVVDKKRKIYFIGNVKFHFDTVAGLGTFVEVEAISDDPRAEPGGLQAQCEHYAELFGINPSDYVHVSYSDLLLSKK